MKKTGIRFLLVFIAMTFVLTGCAQMRDKFIRKKKEEEAATPRYYRVRTYDVKPNLELYTKRYIFWKSWHKEFLAVIRDDNHKKKVVAIEQEVSNLIDMRNMLVDEKAEELQKYIVDMTAIEMQIKKGKIQPGSEVRIRRKMENLGRGIKRNFSYRKVGGDIRDDWKRDWDTES